MFGPIEKRLVWSIVLLAWLGMIIGEVVKYMSNRVQDPPPLSSTLGAKVNRAKQLETLFDLTDALKFRPARNLGNPFYPNPAQPAPPPPPPTTRAVDSLYQGCFSNSQGVKYAYVTVADQLYVRTLGTKVIADYVVEDISIGALTLKDSLGKVVVLPFNVKKPLALPAQ